MSTIREVIISNPNNEDDKSAQISVTNTAKPFVLKGVATVGEKYTFSAWVRSDTPFTMRIAGIEIPVTDEWIRQKVTFIADSKDIKIYFDNLGVYYLYKSQLEIGNIMTDWAMSPFDVEEELNKTNAKLELKVNKDTLISEINASADIIRIYGNRLVIDSTYFTVSEDGTVIAKNMTITGQSEFVSETSDSKVVIKEGTMSIDTYSNSKYYPVITLKYNGEDVMHMTNSGINGRGDNANHYPFNGVVDLDELRVGNYFPQDIHVIDVTPNNVGDGYSVDRSTYYGCSSYNPFSKLVILNETIQIKTTEEIPAGTLMEVGTIDYSEYYPKARTAVAVFANTRNTRRWSASVTDKGEIIVSPSTKLSSGYTYTIYLSSIYSVGRTVDEIIPDLPSDDTDDDVVTSPFTINSYDVPTTGNYGVATRCEVTATSNLGIAITSYQWYYKHSNDEIWNAYSSNSDYFYLNVSDRNISKTEVYCKITDYNGNSDTTIIKTIEWEEDSSGEVENTIVISKHPQSMNIPVGGQAIFSVVATGEGTISYQWQYAESGSSEYKSIIGATSSSTTVLVSSLGYNGRKYRCKITDANGSMYSNAATLSVYEETVTPTTKITIVTQPQDQRVEVGTSAVFSVYATTTASGATLSYKWEYSDNNGSTWETIASTDRTIAVNISNVAYSGRLYRCTISDGVSASVTTRSAVLELYESEKIKYSVTYYLDNVYSSNSATNVEEGASYSTTLTAKEGYIFSYIHVSMYDEDGDLLDITDDVYNDGEIYIPNVTGNITITGYADIDESGGGSSGTTYSVELVLTNCTVSNAATTIAEGETYITTVIPDSGYTINSSTLSTPLIMMGDKELLPYSDYVDYSTGTITIPNVNGDLYIMIKVSD